MQMRRARSGRRSHEAGFSVLEALVAVALIAVAFLPLLALQGQLTRTAIAAERAEISIRAKLNALAYLEVLNPSLRPNGSETLGDAVLEWRAQPLRNTVPAQRMAGGSGRFDITLYEVQCQLRHADGRAEQFAIRKTGWIATQPMLEF